MQFCNTNRLKRVTDETLRKTFVLDGLTDRAIPKHSVNSVTNDTKLEF